MGKVEGACLCGAVSYSCGEPALMTAVCHCENCQRQSGSAFSVIVAVPAGSLKITGEQHLKHYADTGESGQAVDRYFCCDCGSPLLSRVAVTPDVEYIKAGTLYDRSWLDPKTHFFCDSAEPWVAIAEDAERFARNPG